MLRPTCNQTGIPTIHLQDSIFFALAFRHTDLAFLANLFIFSCVSSKLSYGNANDLCNQCLLRPLHSTILPVSLISVVLFMIQSMITMNNKQPCFTLDSMAKILENFPSCRTAHTKPSSSVFIKLIILSGVPYTRKIPHSASRYTVSKAFSKSTKFTIKALYHSCASSIIFLRTKI